MNKDILPSLKLIYKPLVMYYGEWELLDGLESVAKVENGKNLFTEFLNRYYYMPLKVVFKNDDLVYSFKWAISSRLGPAGRGLFFSKRAFLRNIIANANDVVLYGGDNAYKEIKKAIRDRKDVYRDVDSLREESPYYKEIVKEYKNSGLEISLDEYIKLCKKKYTKLLTGYNAVLDLFDKSINVDNFIKCFDIDKLYLFTAYSLLKNSEDHYEKYGNLDYNISFLDSYRGLVNKIREDDSLYNSTIVLGDVVYTIDDLFKEYDELLANAKK